MAEIYYENIERKSAMAKEVLSYTVHFIPEEGGG